MPLIINTNVSALNAQRQLVKSGQDMSQAMERLSSGKRINGAGDDAAGMAIASRMTSQIRGLNQAIRNANDGISLIQTAGGALEESTNILQRMRELSIQSANGIYTDANRVSLNAEVEQLKSELTRIAETTSFNGLKILDGTLGDIELQVGTEAYETIAVNIGDGFDAESLGKSLTEQASGTYTLKQAVNGAQSGDPGSLNGLMANEMLINGVAVPAAELYDTVSTSDNGASALGISEAINSVSDQTGVVATAENTLSLGTVTTSSIVDLGALAYTEAVDATGIVFATGELVIDGVDFAGETLGAGTGTTNASIIAEMNTILDAGGSDVVLSIDPTSGNVLATKGDGGEFTIYSNEAALSAAAGDAFKIGTYDFDVSTGVSATVQGQITLGTGDFVVNGTSITGSFSSNSEFANLITSQSGLTGVTASMS